MLIAFYRNNRTKRRRESVLRAVIQRVSRADVVVEDQRIAEIGHGYLVLLGVATGDTLDDVDYMVKKISRMRLFGDRFKDSVQEISGEILLVSQFTLLADCRRGRRPDWGGAAGSDSAQTMFSAVLEGLRNEGISVSEGRFGAHMNVGLVNDGPVTIIIDSRGN